MLTPPLMSVPPSLRQETIRSSLPSRSISSTATCVGVEAEDGFAADGVVAERRGVKGAVALVVEDGDAAVGRADISEVALAVAIKVGGGDTVGIRRDRILLGRLEGAVAVADQDRGAEV